MTQYLAVRTSFVHGEAPAHGRGRVVGGVAGLAGDDGAGAGLEQGDGNSVGSPGGAHRGRRGGEGDRQARRGRGTYGNW